MPSTQHHAGMSTTPGVYRIVSVAAAVGVVASAMGVVTSELSVTGRLPAALAAERVLLLTTTIRFGSIPSEFVVAVSFGVILSALVLRDQLQAGALAYTCALATVPAGLGFGLWWSQRMRPIPILVAALCGCTVVLVSALASPVSPRVFWRGLKRDWQTVAGSPRAMALCVGTIAAVALGLQYFVLTDSARALRVATTDQLLRWYAAQPRLSVRELVGADVVRIVVFTDYQCPACAIYVPSYESMVNTKRQALGGAAEVVVHDFPLEPECNAVIASEKHPTACEAATAARLVTQVRGPDAGRAFQLWAYRHSDQLTPGLVRAELAKRGLLGEFDKQYRSLIHEVSIDAELGHKLGVNSTPTVFVNGVRLSTNSPQAVEAIVDFELAASARKEAKRAKGQ